METTHTDANGTVYKPCTTPNRFDYVKYDDEATALQAEFKAKFQDLEMMTAKLEDGRAKSLVLTKLEEAYMWVGKSIRDTQVKARGAELQEARANN